MAFVQGDKGSTTGAASVATAGITTTSGNLLIAIVSVNSGPRTVSSLTDSKGNTWTPLTGNPQQDNLGSVNLYAYYAKNITGGAGHTLTANLSASAIATISLQEFSGRDTVSPVIAQVTNKETTRSSSHTSAATGALSTSGCDLAVLAGDSAFGDFGANETYTPGSGWTLPASSTVGTAGTTTTSYILYQENVGTGSQTGTWTNSGGTISATSWIIALAPSGGQTLVAGTGIYSYSGQAATLTSNPGSFTLIALPGSYSYTGFDSTSDLQLDASTGIYSYTGFSVVLTGPTANIKYGVSGPGVSRVNIAGGTSYVVSGPKVTKDGSVNKSDP